ncbi:hypothetical protein EWH99_01095 [Sporolactobacillus sp. THM7-7]|nr:hypothetical protein EWH99_01095 [Sporolactobacillus sp. THM7-7]
MKQVIQTLKRRDAEKRIPVVRMEIDSELTALYRAMVRKDIEAVRACKKKLELLRREMILLEV